MNFQELKEIALKNPKGKITSRSATGPDIRNCGSWKGDGCTRDFYWDVFNAAIRLKSNPTKLIGHPLTIDSLKFSDGQYEHPPYMVLLPLFWWSASKFLRLEDVFIADENADERIVLLVGSDNDDVVYIDTR